MPKILSLVTIMMLAFITQSEDPEGGFTSPLLGIDAVEVNLGIDKEDEEILGRFGLSLKRLQTFAELHLRSHGLPVREGAMPRLHLFVTVFPVLPRLAEEPERFVVAVKSTTFDMARIYRQGGRMSLVRTWEALDVQVITKADEVERAKGIERMIEQQLDSLLNAYHKANSKPPAP